MPGPTGSMFDVPADTWYVWIGLSAVSLAVAGVALALPSAPPPDAVAVADTVDAVAGSPYEPRETVDVSADVVTVDAHGVELQSDGRSGHATFAYRPVVPAVDEELQRVLDGRHPAVVFDDEAAFAASVRSARNGTLTVRDEPDDVTARRIQWRGVDATLVG